MGNARAAFQQGRFTRWLVGAVSLVLAAGAPGCRRTPAPAPNILLFVVDTLRADALGCYGNAAVRTPAMDRLAREGMRFTRAHADASWTRPSMGTLLTGVYPRTHGAVDRSDALRADVPTLAEQLRAHGYETAAIVANPNVGTSFGFARGFEAFIELYQPHHGRTMVDSHELIANAETVVDRAISWLRRPHARPFFLLVLAVDPHAPYTPPPPYDRMYDPTYHGQIDGSLASLVRLAADYGGQAPPVREIRHLRALYDGEVAFTDAQLARLLAEMDRLSLAATTLLVLTADHGEEFYEHGARDHGHTLYEELIHVPLILRWPGRVAPDTLFTRAVQTVDLVSTLRHLAGVAATPAAPGRDLSGAVLAGHDGGVGSFAYADEELDGRALESLIAGDRKVITDAARPAPLIFNLAGDPGELHPMSGPPPRDLARALAAVESRDRAPVGAGVRQVRARDLSQAAREALRALGYGAPRE